jgi:hypothetical protein
MHCVSTKVGTESKKPIIRNPALLACTGLLRGQLLRSFTLSLRRCRHSQPRKGHSRAKGVSYLIMFDYTHRLYSAVPAGGA